MSQYLFRYILFLAMSLGAVNLFASDKLPEKGIEFFETKIRPILVEHCYECHATNSKNIRGGLLVDTRDGLLIGGDSGAAIVPKKLDESLLLNAIEYDSFEMPPKQKLPPEVINDFNTWIKMGAPDPREGAANKKHSEIDMEAGRKFWAFQSPHPHPVPQHETSAWPETAIDHFIFDQQQKAKLTLIPDATRTVLIRRATYALIGLPPTQNEIELFVNDPASTKEAFAKVIDRLLASPHFGERWGRHWLDVVRFAESSGGGRSLMFKDAWRFRDYVIQSYNRDKPIDQLIKEHLAGDLLPYKNYQQRTEQLIATGFLALGPTNYEQQDKEFLRLDVIDEQINTMGSAFLGMTLNCARCHDHKFDPIPTKDYYALAGIFENTQSLTIGNVSHFIERRLPIAEEHQPLLQELENTLAPLKKKQASLKSDLTKERKKKPFNKPRIEKLKAEIEELNRSITALRKKLKPLKPIGMSVLEVKEPKNGHIHIRGSVRNLGPEVPRGFLSVVPNANQFAMHIPTNQSGRLELANWIVDPNNPLTARVYVNRVWRHLFGNGLVRTPDNFGKTGQLPTHPKLLDHLAIQFMSEGWSTKKLIREIMLSHVYRLDSKHDAENAAIDVENRLLWRANRRRQEAESLRDSILAVSGQLDLQAGGNTIQKFSTYDYGYKFNTVRRSVYVPFFRNSMLDLFEVFDISNPNLVTGHRNTSTLATQSLFLMNSPFMIEQSKHTAERLLAVPNLNQTEKIDLLHQWTLGRKATAMEHRLVSEYLQQANTSDDNSEPTAENWAPVCHTLLSCLDFLFID